MIILGIDPGTATTGWGVVEKHKNGEVTYIACGVVSTTPQSEEKRLKIIFDDCRALIKKYKPEAVAVEKLFFNTNAKTALEVGQARGVVMLALVQSGLVIQSYTPLQIKVAVAGYGRADKKQVQEMVKTLLKLDFIPKPDDAADALAVALTQCVSHNFIESE